MIQQLVLPTMESRISIPNHHIDWNEVGIKQVTTDVIVNLQARMSKCIWRPCPGRKMGFIIQARGDLLGIIFLSSPVINLAVRDEYLGLSDDKREKGKQLRHYADLSVCVATQPIGWHWNLGKLCAMVAYTLGDYWEARYGDVLKGIVTSSLYGRSVQYNRIYKFLGYTKGWGHMHITEKRYQEMMTWMRQNGYEVPSCDWSAGSNPRMRRIQAYIKASGAALTLRHREKRGVYYHEALLPEFRETIIEQWYNRWGLPRYERTKDLVPPYETGLE